MEEINFWFSIGSTYTYLTVNRLHEVAKKDYDSAAAVAGAITPVPGGVGPMTIACLLRNTLGAAARRFDAGPIDI